MYPATLHSFEERNSIRGSTVVDTKQAVVREMQLVYLNIESGCF